MATFQYKGIKADGSVAEGQMEAGGRQEAFRQMEGRGLRPIHLAERNGANGAVKTPAKAKPAVKPTVKETPAEKPNASSPGLKLSLGKSTKVTARMLENFTRLLSS